MKNYLPGAYKKAWLAILLTPFLSLTVSAQQVVTYDTTFGGWNAIVTMDKSLTGTDSAAGIVFFPGLGQQNTDSSQVAVYGPHYLIRAGIWDGSVPLSNGVHHPFIISLQPASPYGPAESVLPKIQAILARYRIKRNSFYMTGLSQGGWQANEFISFEPTPGDDTYGHMVKAIAVMEGVEPADSTGIYPGMGYPRKMGHWAKACGGRELWVEGSNDFRYMEEGSQNMCDSVPNSSSYFQVTYGGGAHCCWNSEYDPSTTWTIASNPNIAMEYGQQQLMNVWQWLLRQGDTSMPSYAVTPPPVAPTVGAGSAVTITLPTSTVTLTGTATGNGGATISSEVWTEVSGPVTAAFGSSGSLTTSVTGLTTAGTYQFQLKATDNNGLTGTSTVTVTVNAAPPPPPVAPTVSAGSGVTITLPTSTVTLSGTATGNGGATISSEVWTEVSGPVTAAFGSSGSLTTSVTGLTTAGTYQFQLKATDNNGLTGTSTVTVTVNAAPPPPPVAPTVSAGSGVTITLPTSTVTLSGTATGNGGATISSEVWTEVSGPVTAAFGSSGSLTTSVTGLTTAGTYQFQLQATDNNGLTGTSIVIVTVNSAVAPPPPPPVAPTVSAGSGVAITLPTSNVTLSGTATGNGGATISSEVWTEVSGPVTAAFGSSGSLTTSVTGLTTAGTYQFQLQATDNNGLTGTSTLTVTVNAAPPPPPVAPTVSAGSGVTITLPTSTVTLSGTATGNGGATISSEVWTEVSGPVTAGIGSSGSLTTSVTGLTTAGTYQFQLEATDNNGLIGTSTVTVTVNAAVAPPPPPPVAPTVSAGSAVTITLPTSTVTLSGTATGNGGATISSEGWTEVSGPVTAGIGSSGSLTTSVTGLTDPGTYEFQLEATDDNGLTATATVIVTVNAAVAPPPPVPTAPVAVTGANRTVSLPLTELTLDGSGSYATTSGASIANYSWVQVSGEGGVTIVGSNTAEAELYGLAAGTYTFQLTVTDNNGMTATAVVTVTVAAAGPVANAGQDTTIALPSGTAELNGSGSTDPSGEALTYAWVELSGPGTAVISSPGSATSGVSGLESGLYVFGLTVTNTSGQTDTATVQVRVENNQRTAAVSQGKAQAMVYPNPTEGLLYIQFTDDSTSGPAVFQLYDMRGRLVQTQETTVAGSGDGLSMNLSGLAKGTYLLKIIIGTKMSAQLVVKQ